MKHITTGSKQVLPMNRSQNRSRSRISAEICGAVALALLFFVTGCGTPAIVPVGQAPAADKKPETLTIREGDVLKIAFPGTATLDSQQTVRRDGRITLAIVGEVVVAGLTPSGLEQDLAQRYASQLVSKEVNVTVISSSFPIFVNGAVIRPGKIVSDHPISALEAVMEAGGFDTAKANMKAVIVIRQEAGHTRNFTLNLKRVLDGKQNEPFLLKPSDIVYVPEKFSWF